MTIKTMTTDKFIKAFKQLKKERGMKPGSTPSNIKNIVSELQKGKDYFSKSYQMHRSSTDREIFDIHPGGKGDRNNTVMLYRYNGDILELIDIVTKHDSLDRKIKGGNRHSNVDTEFSISMLEKWN